MSNANQNKLTSLDFYDYYAKREYWTKEEAVALLFGIDLRKIRFTNGRLENDQGEGYNQSFHTKYNERMKLVKEGLSYNTISNNMYSTHIPNNIRIGHWPEVHPLSFINWCENKIEFPEELTNLVKKYTVNYMDWEARCKELKSEKQELEIIVTSLKKELETPNPKRTVVSQKAIIGMLSKNYGRERVLSNFRDVHNKTKINDKTKLTYAQIKHDYNLQGIDLDDQTIKILIAESIYHLEEKPKK